ncbi:MAG: V-type ATP synthase subunit E family protein [Myxococcales bacterium]|nr:V-type ATP synthase subunit E family protein [Myxococcales bacterium]MDH3483442.1 V-type ATP synthase subunit E family protein [Myxococcales bacterium]
MDGPDLTTELRKNAEATAARILESARLEAEQFRTETERQIQRKRAASLREEEERYRLKARSAIAAERHASMRTVLLARARLVDRVLELATSLLPDACRTETYRSSIAQQLDDSMRFIGDEGAHVLCSLELVPTLREAAKAYASVTVEPDAETQSGFVVVSAGGSVTVDKRLGTQLQRMIPALAIEIHDRVEKL